VGGPELGGDAGDTDLSHGGGFGDEVHGTGVDEVARGWTMRTTRRGLVGPQPFFTAHSFGLKLFF